MLNFFQPKSIYDLLHAVNTLQEGLPEQQKNVLVSGFFDWLSSHDEIAFMAEMSKLPSEGRERILNWFEHDSMDNKKAHLFRKFVTTDPDELRRQTTLLSYALINDHDQRTRRFELETIPPWFVSFAKELITKEYWVEKVKDFQSSEIGGKIIVEAEKVYKKVKTVARQAVLDFKEIEEKVKKKNKRNLFFKIFWPF